MKRGIIIKPNQKGQVVIPKEMRNALGILKRKLLSMRYREGMAFTFIPLMKY